MTEAATQTIPRAASVGFERYGLVAYAPPQIREDLRKVRAQCGVGRPGRLDAHVTVKGVFSEVVDLPIVERVIAETIAGVNPFAVRTTDPTVMTIGDRTSIALPLEESRALRALHARLLAALGPHGRHDSAQDQPGAYSPRVTVVQDLPIDGVERAVGAVEGWRLNYFWTVRDVDLIAMRGGLWQTLRVFRFGRR